MEQEKPNRGSNPYLELKELLESKLLNYKYLI